MRRILLLTSGLVVALGGVRAAQADEMTWRIRSSYEYRVQLEFYSQNRGRAWPGGGQAYALNDSRQHEFTLSCQSGEKICYGAWPTGGGSGTYWGVGANNKHGCRTCCAICGRDNPVKELASD